MDAYRLYVPREGVVHDVRPGSAIVGEPRDDGIDTHYEGGGASNVTTLEHRIHHAAGRRRQRYPTSARRTWARSELLDVGSVVYDGAMRHWVVGELTDQAALEAWAPDDPPVAGGTPSLFAEVGGRLFGSLPESEKRRIMAMDLPMPAACAEVVATRRRLGIDATE
jgi:hypothetical protein